jgi:hypothetical protein
VADLQPVERLDAGDFSTWWHGMRAALREGGQSDVPCGSCAACCTSSQFVHIGPDEPETLAAVPAGLLFPAPGMADGHVLLGYDDRGHCPMLVEGRCSIYVNRPRACRTYDCRVFAAAGVELDDERKSAVTAQVRRWQFRFPTQADRNDFDQVRAAAARATGTATRRALIAIDPPGRVDDEVADREHGG